MTKTRSIRFSRKRRRGGKKTVKRRGGRRRSKRSRGGRRRSRVARRVRGGRRRSRRRRGGGEGYCDYQTCITKCKAENPRLAQAPDHCTKEECGLCCGGPGNRYGTASCPLPSQIPSTTTTQK